MSYFKILYHPWTRPTFLLTRHLVTTSISLGSNRYSSQRREDSNKNSRKQRNRAYAAGASFALSVLGAYYFYRSDKQEESEIVPGEFRKDLKSYTLEEVAKHDSQKKGIWVTYKQGVYDITNFVDGHPGGPSKIMMAAGGSIDPFWMMFSNHKKKEIYEILENMRIGNISAEDAKSATANMDDPYANDPKRHKSLIVNNQKPFNAETRGPLLVQSFITPSEVFYVRNHLPVPQIDPETYELDIAVEETTKKTLSLEDIKKYPKHTLTSTVMCAGNRRSEMSKVKPVKGLSWSVGAVGNATWTGARLCDILTDLGIKEEDYEHIQFEGLDLDPSSTPYGSSIPISKAMDPRGDVILAYEMNGEPIPVDHGFPIRAIVPGVVGARNVKWLGRLIVSKEESPSQWQQGDYKGFSPSTDWHNVDFSKSPAIQELPVISAICSPEEGDSVMVENGKVIVEGYAWSGGGQKIVRVDLTADAGKTWHTANFVAQDTAKPGRHWGWTLWRVELPVEKELQGMEIWAKAVDSAYNVQPESFENIWNLRGVLSNAYHRVRVELKQ